MAWTPEQNTRFEELMADPALAIGDVLAGLLPLTPEQLAQLDENGDLIEQPASSASSSAAPRASSSRPT